MTPERWRQVRDVFDRVIEVPPAERARLLAGEAGKDAELAREVGVLIDSSDAAGSFLEGRALDLVSAAPGREEGLPAHSRIGPYEIVRELGHGGMGTVYLASRSDGGFAQTVAVKLVRRGMDTDFILRRFRMEREILAGLEHPNIARLLDGGSTEDGLPYFVMEHIPGNHLLEECRARNLSTRERLALFLPVCDAVTYAHRHLVVHRDIKPSNILVTPEGAPRLLDFGLAKLLQPGAGDGPDRTESALRLLTPDYASPEQVRGERVTTSTDIYSLGVVLYELLAGRRPYRTAGRSPDSIARAVCEEEPERPSTAVAGLRGDLDNIVLMALRKEPERRYASVEQLAEDLRRHLDGRPVLARKDTLGYRAGKFVARHRLGVAAVAAGAALLLAATGVAVRQASIARAERAAAERHFNEVRELTGTFLFEFHDAIKDLPGSTPARGIVVRRALEYVEKLSKVKSGDPQLQRELASAYERVAKVQGGLFESHLGDTEGARKSLLRAVAIRESLSASEVATSADRAALAETELQLAQVLMVAGDASGAASRARRAVTTLTALSAAAPGDRVLQARLGRARRYLGAALSRGGAREEGMGELRAAAAMFESLASADPASTAYRREIGITHQMLVHALGGSGEREAALKSYGKAVAVQEELVRSEPGNFSLKRELAYTHVSMGGFLEWSGDATSALQAYEKALPILESLVEADPKNADARLLLAETRNSVGYGQAVSGQTAAALDNLRRSQALFDQIAAADPTNARAALGLARLYESFGTASAAKPAEALAWYRRSEAAYRSLSARGQLDPQAARELEAVQKKALANPSPPVGGEGRVRGAIAD